MRNLLVRCAADSPSRAVVPNKRREAGRLQDRFVLCQVRAAKLQIWYAHGARCDSAPVDMIPSNDQNHQL